MGFWTQRPRKFLNKFLELAGEDEIGDRSQKIGFLVEQIKVMYRLGHKRLGIRASPLAPRGQGHSGLSARHIPAYPLAC
jgi:hypothetical protein